MKNVILRFLKTYIMMLVIPILFSFIIYFAAYTVIEDITQEASILALNQAESIYEQRFSEISHMTYQLYTNSYALSFSNLSGEDNRQVYSRLLKTQNNLPNYSVTNNFILDYYILFPASQMVVNDRIVYGAREFYQYYLSYEAMSYDEWFAGVVADASRGAVWKSQPVVLDNRYYGFLDGKNIDAVTCLLNTGRNFHDNISVIMLIDVREMEQIISPVICSSEDYACILDNDGLLFDINQNDKYYAYITAKLFGSGMPSSRTYTDIIDGEKVFVTYIHSDELNWSLISIRPYTTVMSNLMVVQRVMIWAACISLLAGIGLAVLFSLKKNSPAMSLFHDNERFQAQIEEQKPIIRSTFMERLFNGMADNQQFQMFLRYLDIPLGNFYTCFVFQFYDDEQMSLDYFERIKLIVKETVNPIPGLYHHDIGSYRIAFMAICQDRDTYITVAGQMIDQIIQDLRPKIPCKIAVSIGKLCTDIRKISLSANSAVEALNYRDWEVSYQIIVADAVNPGNSHTLRNDEIILMLNQLEYCIKNGNTQEVENMFQKIESDVSGKAITQNAVNMVVFSLLNLIANLLDARFESYERINGRAEILSRNVLKNSPSDNVHYLKKMCLELCCSIAAENSDKSNRMITDLLAFLDRNYCNPSISLSMLSDQYAISEAYISQLFKKYTNENISVYIENLRMTKARELLKNPKLSVRDITEQIGYNSTNTFNKAFKKKYGVPPSAYRRTLN